MIHILDCNSLIRLENAGRRVREEHECFVPDEIKDEFLTNPASEAWYGSCEFRRLNLDEAEYLTEYARILNMYNDVSFYNMKGFGDVAVLATLGLLTRNLPRTVTLSADLFPPPTIGIVSGDMGIRDFALREFPGLVTLKTPEDFVVEI